MKPDNGKEESYSHRSKLKNSKQTEKETQMYRIDFWTLWEKAKVGCFERTALKHVYYQGETDHQPRLHA